MTRSVRHLHRPFVYVFGDKPIFGCTGKIVASSVIEERGDEGTGILACKTAGEKKLGFRPTFGMSHVEEIAADLGVRDTGYRHPAARKWHRVRLP